MQLAYNFSIFSDFKGRGRKLYDKFTYIMPTLEHVAKLTTLRYQKTANTFIL